MSSVGLGSRPRVEARARARARYCCSVYMSVVWCAYRCVSCVCAGALVWVVVFGGALVWVVVFGGVLVWVVVFGA
jgi:hypothetical protein